MVQRLHSERVINSEGGGIKESLVEEVPLELSKEEGGTSTEIQGCLGNHEEHHLVGGMGGKCHWRNLAEGPGSPHGDGGSPVGHGEHVGVIDIY